MDAQRPEASVEMYKNEATYFVNSCTTCRPFSRPPAACHLHSSARRASRAAGSASAMASQLRSRVLAWQHLISAWHSSSWLSLSCGSQSRAATPLTGVGGKKALFSLFTAGPKGCPLPPGNPTPSVHNSTTEATMGCSKLAAISLEPFQGADGAMCRHHPATSSGRGKRLDFIQEMAAVTAEEVKLSASQPAACMGNIHGWTD